VKTALSLADFRSYRDQPSLQCVKGIGLRANNDPTYPDLVFSLPDTALSAYAGNGKRKSIVALGLMEYAGQYSTEIPSGQTCRPYLESLLVFVKWLLDHRYDIRLVIGDQGDTNVTREFKHLLKARLGAYDEERIIDQPALSVEQLLPQIAEADIVVATRFHNVLLALLLNKPVIAISFHHKCASLMSEMGLAEYCHDINHMNAGRLIEQFQDVEKNAEKLKLVIRQRVEQSRKALDEQYDLIFKSL
jgi:polysaccharide pyruvyl transferase WcaK-like protein